MRKLWILAVLLAVVFVGPPAWTAGRAAQAEIFGEYMELYGPMCWGPDTAGCVEIDAPNSGTASNRTFFRGDMTWAGTGLADACHDVLDATVSTMSTSAWETLITCTVDVPATTDRVLASVSGQFAWMGTAAFVLSNRGADTPQLCEVADPEAPGAGITCRDLASTITDPSGITPRQAGGFWIINDDSGSNGTLCEIPNPLTPAINVTCRALASEAAFQPQGLAPRPLGGVYLINNRVLCAIPDPSSPGSGVTCRDVDTNRDGQGLATRRAGGLWFVDDLRRLCKIPNAEDPSSGVTCVSLPYAPAGNLLTGLAPRPAGGIYLVSTNTTPDTRLCAIPDPEAPTSNVTCRDMSTLIGMGGGIAGAGSNGECMIRLARGSTAVETLMIDAGRILLDTTFVDVPGVAGSATYNVQMMTANPYTLCTANRGNGLGTIPLPSLLVQVFYGS